MQCIKECSKYIPFKKLFSIDFCSVLTLFIFREFKVPAMKGPKNFENICLHVDELKKTIQEKLKEHIEKPHPERFARVEHVW